MSFIFLQIKESVPTPHRSNIFCAKFLPGSNNRKVCINQHYFTRFPHTLCLTFNSSREQLVACSGGGLISYTDLNDVDTTSASDFHSFDCHTGVVYQVRAATHIS